MTMERQHVSQHVKFCPLKTMTLFVNKMQGTSVSKVTSYRMDDQGSVLSRRRGFNLYHHVQIKSGDHPTSYPMRSGTKVTEA